LLYGVPAGEARVVCVVIHGRYGAPEAMMEHLVQHLTAPDVHYVLPRAAGEGWYTAPSCAPMQEDTRAEIARALAQVREETTRAQAEAPRDARLVIGGFSQGACLALEYAAAFGRWEGAAFALTGCRVGQPDGTAASADLGGFPLYLSTGSADPFIHLPDFCQTLRGLTAAGARVRADVFPRSDHVMSPAEVATVDALLRRARDDEPPFASAAT
jgi:predicted esterase